MENHHSNDTNHTREVLINDLHSLQQNAAALKQNARQVAQDVRDHAQARVEATRQRFRDRAGQLRQTAQSHPVALLGIGLFVGFLLARRRRA